MRWFDCILIWSSSTHHIHSRWWIFHICNQSNSFQYNDNWMIDWIDLPKLTTFIADDHEEDTNRIDDFHTFGHVIDFVLDGIIVFDWMIWSSWIDYNWSWNNVIPSYRECDFIKWDSWLYSDWIFLISFHSPQEIIHSFL